MKSLPEYRHVFLSRSMFFRVLHTLSTQRYRLPVRRYILDLFNIQLDQDVVEAITECAESLQAPPMFKPHKSPSSRVVSMFGRLGHSGGASGSDDDNDIEGTIPKEHPVISLRPMSKVIGFAM
jgi:rapamycin-insensitive companion of mTOR